MAIIETTNLFLRAGSSDKAYQVSLEEVPGGYLVNFAYGRRGSTLKTGTKTKSPVPLDKARSVFQKLVASKTGKGYRVGGEDIGTYTPPELSVEEVAGSVQLLNPIDESDVEPYITDPAYIAQPKKDGKRLQVGRSCGQVYGLNRRGQSVGFPQAIAEAVKALFTEDFLVDGESIGETLWVFDLLAVDGEDQRGRGVAERLDALQEGLAGYEGEALKIVETARTESEKRAMYVRLRDTGQEGIVFKRVDALHTPGRPASGGPWVKFKFYETATVRVEALNTQRSVRMEMLDKSGDWQFVGNVTVPPNQDVPEEGAFIEVRYLYAFEGGSLYQPVLLGVREDVSDVDCSVSQLKFKADENM